LINEKKIEKNKIFFAFIFNILVMSKNHHYEISKNILFYADFSYV